MVALLCYPDGLTPMGRKPTPTGAMRRKDVQVCAALLVAILLIYSQAGRFTVIDLDDTTFTSGNFVVVAGLTWPGVQYAFTTSDMGSWHPLTWLSHMLDYQLFGDDLGSHHWVSIVLHIVNCWLLFWLLGLATGTLWRSAAVAMLFAVHPMHVETVVWLGDRKGLLAAFFWLASTIVWVLSLRRPGRKWSLRAASLALYALGIMAKPVILTLPFALVLFEYWPLGRWNSLRQAPKAIWEKAPLLALSAVFAVVTYFGQIAMGALSWFEHLSVATRLGNAFYAISMYLWKTFWPADLTLNYTLRPLSAVEVAAAVSITLALTALAVWRLRANPYLAFGWFWFTGTLVPTLGLIQQGDQAFADRFSYIPHIGLFIAIVWGVHAVAKPAWFASPAIRLAGAALLGVLIWTSTIQTSRWGNSLSFWERAVRIVPHHVQGHQLLGQAFTNRRDFAKARHHIEQAIQYRPRDHYSFRLLGEMQYQQGDRQKALASLDTAVRLDPTSATAHLIRGMILRGLERNEEALAAIRKALEIGLLPGRQVDAYFHLGRIFHAMGKTEQEAAAFESLLQVDAFHFLGRKNLAYAYMKLGKLEQAKLEFDRLALAAPNDPDVVRSLEYLQTKVP
jgi:tetratricopeptide (TPR) repeat protein